MRSVSLCFAAVMVLVACDPTSPSTDGGVDPEPTPVDDSGTPPDDGGVSVDDSGVSVEPDAGVDNDDAGVVDIADVCAPLPPPTGNTINVTPADVDTLVDDVRNASTGDVFVLAPGTYVLDGILQFRAPGVTLRSSTDNAADVILDGDRVVAELMQITADDVTIAHVTLVRAVDHAVHVTANEADTLRTVLHGVHIVDCGEQFVKINSGGDQSHFADDGVVSCSTFTMTDDGRPHVERNPGGCYTGGIDAHRARGWNVHHNHFEGIYCAGEGLAEHAVHFWRGSRDTVVDSNTIRNCARGVGFGLTDNGDRRVYDDEPDVGYIGHLDGVVVNNRIFADIAYYDTGVELNSAHGAVVVHNTVFSTSSATGFYSSIDRRFASTDVVLQNNLVRRLTDRGGAADLVGNVETTDEAVFADLGTLTPAAGANTVVDQGTAHSSVSVDAVGTPRPQGGGVDVGAIELLP